MPSMPKAEHPPDKSSPTLRAGQVGTISVSRLMSFLKTLERDSRIGIQITRRGVALLRLENPLGLYLAALGEPSPTGPTSNLPDDSPSALTTKCATSSTKAE